MAVSRPSPAPAPVEVSVQAAASVAWPVDADPSGWVAAAFAAAGDRAPSAGSVTVRLVDRDEMQALNAGYRGQQRPTNVLAFPAPVVHGMPAGAEAELGDVLVCLPVAATEAQAQRKTLQAHLAHLVVHGSLHLLGYDHEADDEAEVMEAAERRALSKMGFPDPYQEAAC